MVIREPEVQLVAESGAVNTHLSYHNYGARDIYTARYMAVYGALEKFIEAYPEYNFMFKRIK